MSTPVDTPDVMAAIEAMAERLRDEYGASAVILYGSRADGSARPDSDVDLLIIKSGASGVPFGRFKEVQAVLSDIHEGLSLDTHTYTPEEIKRTLALGDHFVQDIILRGRALHKGDDFAQYIELAKKSYSTNPEDSKYPEVWIEIAEDDYETVTILLNGGRPRGAGYFLHQAVEKFFKSYLIRRGWRLRRTHDLGMLLDDAVRYDATLEQYRAVCELVSLYQFAERYPRYTTEAYYPSLPVMDDEGVRAAFAEITPLVERLRAGSAKTNNDDEDK